MIKQFYTDNELIDNRIILRNCKEKFNLKVDDLITLKTKTTDKQVFSIESINFISHDVVLELKPFWIKLNDIDNFFFDLDGTLLNSRTEINDKNLNALNSLIENNKNIFVATGRPPFTAWDIVKNVPTKHPLIFANGSIILNDDYSLLKTFHIPNKIAIQIYKKLIELEYDFLVYTPEFVAGYNTYKTDFFVKKKYFSRIRDGEYKEGDFSNEIEDWTFCKFLVLRESNPAEKWNQILNLEKDFDGIYGVVSQEPFLDIMSINATKGNAIKYLLDLYDLSVNRTISFGDADNDESMFEATKYSGVMPNGMKSVQNSALLTMDNNDSDWLSDFIGKIN
ncbi:Cof-type HAD-IIB family hydrolase [Mycoplasma sp. CSL10137]|uniref:HAD family hydrolase n=1 Tax=unclassified Mycoplasma TaxID=2683645 RepID=UPI00197B9E4F|nr:MULTISPECIES: HAD family hydrolase [unclassified Mycoplasma]MBN4083316.1 Cof-type HAD-IIB family hydrolase [Mycoplasma sp. CSL10137]MBN4084381.1 Cof-type HAD-IIB family hydrolase [Mycoplasma sp. CSL10166]MBU4692867.1 HAD family hydrolase [Mycoplasma sp. CSL7491-lung]